MAIIYTYPQINSSSDLAASDLMIISDMSANGRPTKSLKLSDLATFITNTGTGSGTTNKITKWTDGASGVLGDSSITDTGTQVSMSSDFIINSNGGVNNVKFITDWGDHRVSILDALGAYTFTAADLDGGGKIGVNKQVPSTTLHVGGTGTFDSSLSIPLIPTANAHATSKQYVDQQIASIPAGLVFKGNWNASTNTPALASGTGTVGNYYVVSVAGNTNLDGITDWEVGDWAVFVEVGGVDKWDKIDQTFVQGAGAVGQVSFWNGINSITGDTDLYWDDPNKRLGIGTTSPDSLLEISSGSTTDFLKLTSTGSNASPTKIIFEKSATEQGIVEYVRNGDLRIYNTDADGGVLIDGSSASGNDLYVKNDGNVGIGTTSPDKKLDVTVDTSDDGVILQTVSGRKSLEALVDNGANGQGKIHFYTGANLLHGRIMADSNGLNISQLAADKDIIFQADDGSGGLAEYFKLDGSLASGGELKTLFPDNSRIVFGDSADFNFYHDGTDSRIQNTTGHIRIINFADDKDIIFQSDDGSGGVATYFKLDGSSTDIQYFKDLLIADNIKAMFGNGVDLRIYHDGSHSYVQAEGTGNLYIEQKTDDKDIIFQSDDGSGGITEYFRLDGGDARTRFSRNLRFSDNVRAEFGNSGDFDIYYDGSDAYLVNGGSAAGDIQIVNNTDDGDIKFFSDDGTGSTTEYFRVDGGEERNIFSKDIKVLDNVFLNVGTSNDLQLVHDSTNTEINNNVGHLTIQNKADDSDIIFKCDNGSGGVTNYLKLWGAIESLAVYKDMLFVNDGNGGKLKFGASQDLQIYHDGSNSFIEDTGTGDLKIKGSNDIFLLDGSNNVMIEASAAGSVDLYHNNNKKLETTSTGVKITGQMDLAALNTAVTNSDDNGNVGEIRFTADYIYVCVADDTWKRVALSTW